MNRDFLDRILQAIQEETGDPVAISLKLELAGDDELTWLVDILALPHWFDLEMVRAFTDDPEADGDEIWLMGSNSPVDALFDLSFVHALPRPSGRQDLVQRYQIASAQRRHLLQSWQDPARRDELREFHGRFYKMLYGRAQRAQDQDAALLEREMLYHRFVSNEAEAREQLRLLFEQAEASAQLGICQVLLNYAQEQRPFLEQPSTAIWLDYYAGRLQLMQGEWRAAESAFSAVLAADRRVARAALRARAQASLGDVWRATGDWARARAAYEASLWTWLGQAEAAERTRLEDLLAALNPEPLLEMKTADTLEIARVLIRMADLAVAMARPQVSLADLRRGRALREKTRPAAADETRPTGWRERLRRQRQLSEAYADLGVHEAQATRGVLTAIIHGRLQALAGTLYERAEAILDLAAARGLPSSQVLLAGDMRRDALSGLAQVRLAQGLSAEARQRLTSLTNERLSPTDKAELQLALGDCDFADDALAAAIEEYQQAADSLAEGWNRTLAARAFHRLGRAQALGERWEEAVPNLARSRELFAILRSPREEQGVQETLREISRDELVPEAVRSEVRSLMADWPAHHFAYPSSVDVLGRVARFWYPIQAVLIVAVAVLAFFVGRATAAGLVELIGLGRLANLWWTDLLLGLLALILSLFIVDQLTFFRELVGGLVRLDLVWGSQPGLVSIERERYVKRDFGGQARIIPWREVVMLRRGHSKSWVVGEAQITAPGQPGGRSILYGPDGALTYDASLNSYFELDELVADRVATLAPGARVVQKEFLGTFRSMTGWLMLLVILAALVGCPATVVLTSAREAWWLSVLQGAAWILVASLGVTLSIPLIWLLSDAVRMRLFLYPGDLPDPPPPAPAFEELAIGYEERTLI